MVKKIRKCEICSKEYDSELGFNNHMNKEHSSKGQTTSTMIQPQKVSEQPTQPLKDVAEVDKDRLKLKSLELSEAHLDKDLEKLQKEKEAKDKGKIDINELLEWKKVELLTTQKPQADGFSSILPLFIQTQQQSAQFQQQQQAQMFQMMMEDRKANMELLKLQLQSQLQNNGFQNIGSLVGQINGIKDLARELGWTEGKTDTFIQQTISQLLDTLSPTLLAPIGEAIGEKIRAQQHHSSSPINVEPSENVENHVGVDVNLVTENQNENPFSAGMYRPSKKDTLRQIVKEELQQFVNPSNNTVLRLHDDLFPPPEIPQKPKTVDDELKERFGV